MKTIITLCVAIIVSASIHAQELPVNPDSTGMVLPPIENLDVLKQSNLRGDVQMNQKLQVTGDGMFKSNANVQGQLQALDLKITRDIMFTGMPDKDNPVDQWIKIDEEGKLHGVSVQDFIKDLYSDDVVGCSETPGVPYPPRWINPVGTANLVTHVCQPKTLVGINTQNPEEALDVYGTIQTNEALQVLNHETLNSLKITENQINNHGNLPLQINNHSGNRIEFGADEQGVEVITYGTQHSVGMIESLEGLQVTGAGNKQLTISENSINSYNNSLFINAQTGNDVKIGTDSKKATLTNYGDILAKKDLIVSKKLGVGVSNPVDCFQVGTRITIGTHAISSNTYWDDNYNGGKSRFINDDIMGYSMNMQGDKTYFTFMGNQNGVIKAGETPDFRNYVMQMEFEKIGVNYGWNADLEAAFNIKPRAAGQDIFLVEDANKNDLFKIGDDGITYAEEIKIQLGEFPDYVFEKNYDLPTLKEVETHIQEKGHLPNIPSAAEVDKNGIGVGELQVKLLEKIEELTLYLLDQQKQIEQQQKEIEALRAQYK